MTKPESPRVYDREHMDLTHLRKVATIHINGGGPLDVTISDTGQPSPDIFWVDDPSLDVIVCTNTIRQAINHALKGAGWG